MTMSSLFFGQGFKLVETP